MRIAPTLLLVFMLSLLGGCSLFGSDDDEAYYLSEQELYDSALGFLQKGGHSDAIDRLEKLESYYPFGRYSEQAQLELIYAYFKNGNTTKALAAADRFIRLHPQHENLDYVYYMRGLANFEADISLINRYVPTDSSQRDPGAARDSFNDFATLLTRFPNSQYAPDARKRMIFLKNQLAAYEIHVGHYYIRRGAFIAAANRGRYVVENYPQTPATPHALALMVQAYDELGLRDAAAHAQKVLNSNYPDFGKAPEEADGSMLNTLTFGLLGEDGQPNEASTPRYSSDVDNRPKATTDSQATQRTNGDANRRSETNKDDATAEQERSLFDTLTFGIFE